MKSIIIAKIFLTLLITLAAVSCVDNKNNRNTNLEETEEKIILIFGTQEALDQNIPSVMGYKAFADKLKELSGGTMIVEFTLMVKFNNMEEMINGVLNNTFDIVAAGYSNLDYVIPDLFILSQVTRDIDHFLKILESPFGQELQAQFHEVGVIPSSPWYMGTRKTTINTPINKLADFKKLKMRTVPTEAGKVFARSMGIEIVPLNLSELYAALKDGKVNAQENPLFIIEASKFYEYQKYIAMTEHAISATALFLNKAKYDTFTVEQKVWYHEAVVYGGKVCSNIVLENESHLLEELVKEHEI